MLINSIKKSYRSFINQTDSVQAIVAAPGIRKAANSGGFRQSEMQARRQRRERRIDRVRQHGSLGWSVRAW